MRLVNTSHSPPCSARRDVYRSNWKVQDRAIRFFQLLFWHLRYLTRRKLCGWLQKMTSASLLHNPNKVSDCCVFKFLRLLALLPARFSLQTLYTTHVFNATNTFRAPYLPVRTPGLSGHFPVSRIPILWGRAIAWLYPGTRLTAGNRKNIGCERKYGNASWKFLVKRMSPFLLCVLCLEKFPQEIARI